MEENKGGGKIVVWSNERKLGFNMNSYSLNSFAGHALHLTLFDNVECVRALLWPCSRTPCPASL